MCARERGAGTGTAPVKICDSELIVLIGIRVFVEKH